MQIEYLEIVTPEVEATCKIFAEHHGAVFSDPVPELGNARLADHACGGRISVRAPMAEHETPTVRPYMLVGDIEAASHLPHLDTAGSRHPNGSIGHQDQLDPGTAGGAKENVAYGHRTGIGVNPDAHLKGT